MNFHSFLFHGESTASRSPCIKARRKWRLVSFCFIIWEGDSAYGGFVDCVNWVGVCVSLVWYWWLHRCCLDSFLQSQCLKCIIVFRIHDHYSHRSMTGSNPRPMKHEQMALTTCPPERRCVNCCKSLRHDRKTSSKLIRAKIKGVARRKFW